MFFFYFHFSLFVPFLSAKIYNLPSFLPSFLSFLFFTINFLFFCNFLISFQFYCLLAFSCNSYKHFLIFPTLLGFLFHIHRLFQLFPSFFLLPSLHLCAIIYRFAHCNLLVCFLSRLLEHRRRKASYSFTVFQIIQLFSIQL